jgi:signal transduction histidine kinase
MLKTSVKNWANGLADTLKQFTVSGTVSRDRALVSTTLLQLVLVFILLGGLIILVALPGGRVEWLPDDWRAFFLLLCLAGLGYFFVSRRILARLSREVRNHHQFLSDASHELRTPLTIMKTQLEIALHHDNDDVNHVETMRDTLQEVERMQKIVEDMLLLSKNYLQDKKQQPQQTRTPLNLLLEEMVSKLQPYAATKNTTIGLEIRLRRGGEMFVRGDRVKLSEALMNVIRNAIEYMKPEGGHIQVTAYRVPAPNLVAVKVADNGIGIESRHLPYIFNRFYQVDKTRALSEGGGSGLGLPITKSIIEHYGGTVEIESEYGVGTSITLFLERDVNNGKER